MVSVAAQTRVKTEGGPEGLEIVLPASRNLSVVVVLGVWLVGWFIGEMNVLANLHECPGLVKLLESDLILLHTPER